MSAAAPPPPPPPPPPPGVVSECRGNGSDAGGRGAARTGNVGRLMASAGGDTESGSRAAPLRAFRAEPSGAPPYAGTRSRGCASGAEPLALRRGVAQDALRPKRSSGIGSAARVARPILSPCHLCSKCWASIDEHARISKMAAAVGAAHIVFDRGKAGLHASKHPGRLGRRPAGGVGRCRRRSTSAGGRAAGVRFVVVIRRRAGRAAPRRGQTRGTVRGQSRHTARGRTGGATHRETDGTDRGQIRGTSHSRDGGESRSAIARETHGQVARSDGG